MKEAVEREGMRKLGFLGFIKQPGKQQFYPTPGRLPGRPVETESNLDFSRSTGFGQKFFFYFRLDRSTGPMTGQLGRPVGRSVLLKTVKKKLF